ncbi:transmembrane emp24 domain-containing protein 11-like [Latimeria chalumnae]|uniref:transmembrane emp24 domain-containing protein 11-like n=1 Tax=Latimeria chalumnae TaxID=7897 RepID=UPI00313BB130
MKFGAILFLLSLWFMLSPALYFHMGEREEKCIIEDVPSDTLVMGRYKMQQWDITSHEFHSSAPGLGMVVTIKTPDGKELMSKLYGPESRFSFTSYSSGDHYICLQSNSTRFKVFEESKLRVHLDIQLDEQSLDENIAQAKDKMNEVKIRIQHLRQQIQHISKEQNYQREREEHFRETSEGTNNNILWWAIVQTIILCLVGIWQMKHMKDFLIAKKLV